MLRGASKKQSFIKGLKIFFSEELEVYAGGIMSYKDLEALFILYVGIDTPKVAKRFKFFCKAQLIEHFPLVVYKHHHNDRSYKNVRRKLAH